MWAECLRVLKPGGHLLAFGGTRTYHRMAVAIEDVGFEVRDMIEFCYGSGFPKSLNIWKHLKKKCTCGNMEVYEKRIQLQQTLGEAETEYEMRLMQESDLSQTINTKKERGEVLQSGLSEQSTSIKGMQLSDKIREGQPSVEGRDNVEKNSRKLSGNDLCEMSEGLFANGEERRIHNATQISNGSTSGEVIGKSGSGASQRPQSEKQQYREPCAFCKQYGTQAIRAYGWGSAMKPSHEPICVARKPLSEKSLGDNFLKYGTGGINIDESRVEADIKNDPNYRPNASQHKGHGSSFSIQGDGGRDKSDLPDEGFHNSLGRFPANLIHDNSEEVRECFPETHARGNITQKSFSGGEYNVDFGQGSGYKECGKPYDSGNASRFFKSIIYQAKSSKSDRNSNGAVKNIHPTCKPTKLMGYLIKMVTPKGGTVLDPFMGSGTTGVACVENGFGFIGIERDEAYLEICKSRTEEAKKRIEETPLTLF